MKRKEKLILAISSLLGLTYASNFVVTVDKKSDYVMDEGTYSTNVSEWINSGEEYDCSKDLTINDVYYGKSFIQTTECSQNQERTITNYKTFSNGSKKEVSSSKETQTILTTKTDSLTGAHLEASCKDALAFDSTLTTQRYTIALPTYGNVRVTCDMDTDGGGWTLIQYRTSFYDFYRTWAEYKAGFGTSSNFWLGNDYINDLTKNGTSLYIKLTHGDGTVKYAKYSNFSVNNEANKYKLTVSGYTGTANDSFSTHNGYYFSTKDRDYDTATDASCAQLYKGAWWYSKCHSSNLNGYYYNGAHSSYADGVNWYHWTGHYYSLPKTTMMVR